MYEPESQSLSIELLYESEVIDPVTISVNSTDIWNYSPVFSNEQTIIDSQFIIPDYETNIIWIHLYTNTESSIPHKETESFPIIIHSKTVWARNPKDLVWEQTSASTMGLRNQLQKRDDGRQFKSRPNPLSRFRAF